MSTAKKSPTGRHLACLAALAAAIAGMAMADGTPKAPEEPWIAPARAARKPNPVPANDATITKGKEYFTMACLPCHGPTGRGDGPAAASLERKPGNLSDPKIWEQPDGALFWKVSEGKSPMPVFQETFTEEQRWQIVNYVRTLAPRPSNSDTSPKQGN